MSQFPQAFTRTDRRETRRPTRDRRETRRPTHKTHRRETDARQDDRRTRRRRTQTQTDRRETQTDADARRETRADARRRETDADARQDARQTRDARQDDRRETRCETHADADARRETQTDARRRRQTDARRRQMHKLSQTPHILSTSLYQIIWTLTDPENGGFWKTYLDKEKMLVTSSFSCYYNVFYSTLTKFNFCHLQMLSIWTYQKFCHLVWRYEALKYTGLFFFFFMGRGRALGPASW